MGGGDGVAMVSNYNEIVHFEYTHKEIRAFSFVVPYLLNGSPLTKMML